MAEPRRTGGGATATRTAKQRAQYQRPTTTVRTDRSGKADINSGLTPAQQRAVTAWEDKNRDFKTEHTVLVDEQGRIDPRGKVQVGSGSSSRARISSAAMVENGVLTHNHPSNSTGDIAGRVGVPLSGQDVWVAAKYNLKEVRAVSPHYTYSVRRPAGGWPSGWSGFSREFQQIADREARSMFTDTMRVLNANGGVTRNDADVYNNRINTVASHRAMQAMAKKYGFTYTRRRTR